MDDDTVDFKILVEFTCENFCTRKDLKNKTPREMFDEVTQGLDYYRLFCGKPTIKKITPIDKYAK